MPRAKMLFTKKELERLREHAKENGAGAYSVIKHPNRAIEFRFIMCLPAEAERIIASEGRIAERKPRSLI